MPDLTENRRQGWCDLLRCLACAAVVVLHATGGPISALSPASASWLGLVLLNAATRWSVPVFVMLSGAFLLDPARPFSPPKWRRRLVKLALVTLLAAYLFALWDTRQAHPGLEHLLEALILVVRGDFHYHLWFLPMLLGLYLLTPPLRAMVRGASRRTLWYTVGLWALFALALPFGYRFSAAAPALPWLERIELYNAFGYAGYFLLGYLLKTCSLQGRRPLGLSLAGGASLVLTAASVVLLSRSQGTLDARFLSSFSPLVALTAAALFLALRRLNWGKSPIWARLSRLTLWVYLLHPLVLELIL